MKTQILKNILQLKKKEIDEMNQYYLGNEYLRNRNSENSSITEIKEKNSIKLQFFNLYCKLLDKKKFLFAYFAVV